jgi:hypothetical protein
MRFRFTTLYFTGFRRQVNRKKGKKPGKFILCVGKVTKDMLSWRCHFLHAQKVTSSKKHALKKQKRLPKPGMIW